MAGTPIPTIARGAWPPGWPANARPGPSGSTARRWPGTSGRSCPWGPSPRCCGSRSTRSSDDQPGAFGGYRLRGFAIGDSCLFHVRRGELVRSFPLETAAQFQADPIVLGSIDLKRDHLMRFTMLNELCYPDDLLILCTDALAEWALKLHEAGGVPDWDRCGGMAEADWQAQIAELRRCATSATTTPRWCSCGCWPRAETTGARDSGPAAGGQWNVEELSKKAKEVSGQVVDQIDQVSERMARGFLKFKDKAVKKYRDKFGPDKKK